MSVSQRHRSSHMPAYLTWNWHAKNVHNFYGHFIWVRQWFPKGLQRDVVWNVFGAFLVIQNIQLTVLKHWNWQCKENRCSCYDFSATNTIMDNLTQIRQSDLPECLSKQQKGGECHSCLQRYERYADHAGLSQDQLPATWCYATQDIQTHQTLYTWHIYYFLRFLFNQTIFLKVSWLGKVPEKWTFVKSWSWAFYRPNVPAVV